MVGLKVCAEFELTGEEIWTKILYKS
jgi:hypothetical protein